jgi:hypothetical protein
MTKTDWFTLTVVGLLSLPLSVALAFCDDPAPSTSSAQPSGAAEADPSGVPEIAKRVSVAEAKSEAKLLHDVYQSTLNVMHHHYFRAEGAVLPARAMEDIFAGMEDYSAARAHWISVNTEAMNIDHEPATEFEKYAAKEIAAGKDYAERVQDGYYERVGSIPLKGGCVGCHSRHFGSGAKSLTRKFAGLVIRIPVTED